MKFDIDFIRSLRDSAEAYFNLGFNVTGIKDFKKGPYHKWKHFQSKEQVIWDAVSHEWYNLTGIGVITGIKSKFCLDFDKCDLVHLPSFLEMLCLPADYNWVVVSGSGKGFHIWFSSDELQKTYKNMGTTVVVYKPKQPEQFNQIELRLNCHVVMPPSKSATGGQYHFLHPNNLTKPPNQLQYERTVKLFVEKVGAVGIEPTQGELFPSRSNSLMEHKRNRRSTQILTSLETFDVVQDYVNEISKRRIDITHDYEHWLLIAFAFADEFDEAGRPFFHQVCSAGYAKYRSGECDQFFSDILIQNRRRDPSKTKVTIATFFKLAHDAGIKFNRNGNK